VALAADGMGRPGQVVDGPSAQRTHDHASEARREPATRAVLHKNPSLAGAALYCPFGETATRLHGIHESTPQIICKIRVSFNLRLLLVAPRSKRVGGVCG
jgi:hypothetical protein